MNTEIDDLLEKTNDVLNNPNKTEEFEKNLNKNNSFQNTYPLEQKYENLKEKFSIFENNYDNLETKIISILSKVRKKDEKWEKYY